MKQPHHETYVARDAVDVIDVDIIKLMKDLAPMTINVHLKMRFSNWQRFRLWLGLKYIVWGARLTGLPIEINIDQEGEKDGSNSDSGQQRNSEGTGRMGRGEGRPLQAAPRPGIEPSTRWDRGD